jgi:hypothetical protein
MSRHIVTSFAAALLPLGLAWGAAAGGSLPADATGKPPSCNIRVGYQGGSVVLEPRVFVAGPVSGVYEMRVAQAGANRADIHQSGDFAMAPGMEGSLGIVSLSVGSGGYVATLTVHWGGDGTNCTAHASSQRTL